MTTPQQWDNLIGLTATDADGDKIGNVGQVYLDDSSGEPAWVTVKTGLFGTAGELRPALRRRGPRRPARPDRVQAAGQGRAERRGRRAPAATRRSPRFTSTTPLTSVPPRRAAGAADATATRGATPRTARPGTEGDTPERRATTLPGRRPTTR